MKGVHAQCTITKGENQMDYRDELDRAAHIHGYEEREDEPD